LYNRCFYVSTVWSPYPDYLDEWYSGGKDNKKKNIKENIIDIFYTLFKK